MEVRLAELRRGVDEIRCGAVIGDDSLERVLGALWGRFVEAGFETTLVNGELYARRRDRRTKAEVDEVLGGDEAMRATA